MLWLAFISLVCALLPAGLFWSNRRLLTPPPPAPAESGDPALATAAPGLSVLIPARNEAAGLGPVLESVLASRGVDLEIVVLDDHSEDETAAVVRKFARRDARVRLEPAPELPPGWNGKQHANHCLAGLARQERLLFLDADVRLAPDALARLTPLLAGAELWSGVPRQLTGSFSEKLLLPLIHFVLLGYLPLSRMRASREPALGAGCGQLFLTTQRAYQQAGGHAAIRASLHDGLHLPRLYRRAGLRTDLTDVTALATCRMYFGNRDTWLGLARNAHQGMGAWRAIFPMTLLLFGGQVLPALLLLVAAGQPGRAASMGVAGLALALGYAVRLAMARRYRQSWLGAALHPLGVLGLLAIQWWARGRASLGAGSRWKGRVYYDGGR